MKKIVYLSLVVLFGACSKDNVDIAVEEEEQLPFIQECIIVGDSVSNNVHFNSYSPHISLTSQNVSVFHSVDMDSDGIDDYQFEVWATYPLAGGWFNGCYVRMETLSPEAQVSLDSAEIYPKQYEENDTLFQDTEWSAGQYIISSNGDDPNDGCFGPGCPNISHGMWFGTTDKYIGVRMNGAIPRLGWIKISLPSTNVNWGQTLVIESFACVP